MEAYNIDELKKHIPKIFSCEGNTIYMEYVKGPTLGEILESGKYTDKIGELVHEAILKLSMSKIIHRDMHPYNIIIDKSNRRAVIIDFGRSGISDEDVHDEALDDLDNPLGFPWYGYNYYNYIESFNPSRYIGEIREKRYVKLYRYLILWWMNEFGLQSFKNVKKETKIEEIQDNIQIGAMPTFDEIKHLMPLGSSKKDLRTIDYFKRLYKISNQSRRSIRSTKQKKRSKKNNQMF